jgi:2-oxoglutarate dehydrogenase E1 component
VVINNQIGFTTDSDSSRSGRYCTEIAKTIEAPILHVNGDDPESCYKIAIFAAKYREKFHKDIIIDIVCYRRYGHNEGDEPLYTQPKMYREIAAHPTVSAQYVSAIINQGIITQEDLNVEKSKQKSIFEYEYDLAKNFTLEEGDWLQNHWSGFTNNINELDEVSTAISHDEFNAICKEILSQPKNFTINPKLKKIFDARQEAVNNGIGIDWSMGEMLCYGSVMLSGGTLRFTGQDVERGTFSHRHAVLTNFETNEKYNILAAIGEKYNAKAEIFNSCLSEFAVMGYEYGYSTANPKALTIWEAQFGDFANGATTILDQFISSAEYKWLRLSGLTLLLPHGFEGQGPEHSSCRIERYLQACAENNIIIANCTTPSNIFHILRRQFVSKVKKPLIIATPKSLLRHKMAVSSKADFIEGSFQKIIGEINTVNNNNITKIIITSGRLYYDIYQHRQSLSNNNTVIIRIEQYYPFPQNELLKELNKYTNATQVIWAQEEPYNMGAWFFVKDKISTAILASKLNHASIIANVIKKNTSSTAYKTASIDNLLCYIGRTEAAVTATGSHHKHEAELASILHLLFD